MTWLVSHWFDRAWHGEYERSPPAAPEVCVRVFP